MFLKRTLKIFRYWPLLVAAIFIIAAGCGVWIHFNYRNPISGLTNNSQAPIGRQYDDRELFLSAIARSTAVATSSQLSGVIIPHHLLAKQLIADSLVVASGGHYQDIVLLSPDHYSAGKTIISVSERNFSTVFGDLDSDRALIKLLKSLSFVDEANFFYREHGLQASLPFIKYYFPQARIVAITFRSDAKPEQLDALIDLLEENLPADTLVIQSTDFSHYLTPLAAAGRDEETLAVLKDNQPDKIWDLNQPANIDSLAAAYVQLKLQSELFKSRFIILAHHNSQEYSLEPIVSSTSYLSGIFK